MSQLRVNMRSKVANADIRHEKRNGRDVIIVPAATLPDDVVMNGIKYPKEFIANVYKTLERTPAPVGHPKFNGVHVNASDPEAMNGYGVGAWNENVRRRNGRVFLDKVIDVEIARNSEKGRNLLAAVETGEPIHTSTGLNLETRAEKGNGYTRVAVNGKCDHDAFLLGEAGAATPEQGVGVFVNSQGEQLEVVNAEVPDWIDDIAHRMAFDVIEATDMAERRSKLEKVKAKFVELFGSMLDSGSLASTSDTVVNSGDSDMTPEELKQALDTAIKPLQDGLDAVNQSMDTKIAEALKPIKEGLDAVNAEAKAASEAEHAKAVEAVVNAKLMDEAEAKALPLNALNSLVKATKKPAPVAGGFAANSRSDDDAKYDTLPE